MSDNTPFIKHGVQYSNMKHYTNERIEDLKEFGIMPNEYARNWIAEDDRHWKTNLRTWKGKGKHAASIAAQKKWRMNHPEYADYTWNKKYP